MEKPDLIAIGKQKGLNNSDIESIILHNTSLSKNQYFLVDKIDSTSKIIKDFKRVCAGEPIQYVVNRSEFYGRNFYVDNSVLIPRIDTELMIDIVKEKQYSSATHYLDVGTGSGIIALSLAFELEGYASMRAVDYSSDALLVAQKNRDILITQKKIEMSLSYLLDSVDFTKYTKAEIIVIVANLPYIKNKDFANMGKTTLEHEPDCALYGGKETGFELYQELISQCQQKGKEGYRIELYIEIGFDQSEVAKHYLATEKLDFEFFKDSATIERVIYIHGF